MAKLDQTEQRLRMELRRKNAALQTALGSAGVQRRLAQNAGESPERRASARDKYNKLQAEITRLRREVKGLEDSVKKEQGRKEAGKVKTNYDRLKQQYDLLLDKNTPEAQRLADRVNVEVNKLNAAYQQSGTTTRVPLIRPVGAKTTTKTGEEGRPQLGAAATAQVPTATTATGPVAGTGTGGGKGGKGGDGGDGGKGGDGEKKTPEQRYADAIAMAVDKYNMPDIIFRNVDSLKELLRKYVDNKLTDQQFALEIQNDPWYRSNSSEIKARYVQLFNYEDLVKSGRATGTTDYEQQIARISRTIQARAREMNGIDLPDDQAKLLAKDLYIFNLDNDPAILTERLARFIRPSAGMIAGQPTIGYGGQALTNYQTLQAIAKANGFKLEQILPKDATGKPMTAEGTLEQLATGKLDINRIAQDVRKLAAIGQSDYVKDLLGQGYDLENIYAPYRERMATILELDPNTISLNDPTLRMGIGKQGDLNLYDYERALRADSRWQFTKGARDEVSSGVLQVLRDFGFQG